MHAKSTILLCLAVAGVLVLIGATGLSRSEVASAELSFTEVRATGEPATFVPANDRLLLGEDDPTERDSGRPAPNRSPAAGYDPNPYNGRGALPQQNTPSNPQAAPDEPAGDLPSREQQRPAGNAPDSSASGDLLLSVPRLGIEDLPVPTGSGQRLLDRAGIMHLAETGAPWEPGSNTYIAGHAIGYEQTRYPYVFYELENLQRGDEITLRDPAGRTYTYRVYETLVVSPTDYWVTYPVPNRTTVTLQTCTPIPSFEDRLVVRGELV
jgi:sortase A